jgi:plastocyanin
MHFRVLPAARAGIVLAALLLAACRAATSSEQIPVPTVPPVATGRPAALEQASPEASPSAAGAVAGAAAAATPAPLPTGAAQTAATASAGAGGPAVELAIGTDSCADLKFVPDRATAKSGANVRLTFKNASTQPHNLTFQQGITAKSRPIVAPGESDTIQFTAPAAGNYGFACTIHPTMTGTLTVQP